MEETNQQPVQQVSSKLKTIHRAIQTAAVLILFGCVAILISGAINKFLTAGLTLTLSIFIIISLGATLCLPWVARVTRPNQRIFSIVMLSLIGGSALLWVISAIFIYLLYKNYEAYTPETIVLFLNFIKICMIISFQAIEANMISLCIIKYKKQYIPFQAIMYASYLFIDFWVSIVIGGVSITTADGLQFKPIIQQIFTPGMWTMLVIAIAYVAIANGVINSIEARKNGDYYDYRGRRRRRGAALTGALMDSFTDIEDYETKNEQKSEQPKVETKTEVSAEEKLAKLKDLLDKNLITEEEYNQKKAKILEEM